MTFRRLFLLIILFPAHSASAFGSEAGISSIHFERLGPFGGDVRSLLIDAARPWIAYLGTSNGKIFKSVDHGKSWTLLYPGIGRPAYAIETLVQHPSEPDHIYAGAWDLHSQGGGLYESRDGGLAWTRIALPQTPSAVRGFDVCKGDPSHMIVGTLTGVFVSGDAGRNWRQVGASELQKIESVAVDPKNYRNLYVGTWRLSYRSNDFGKTWTRINKGMPLDSDVFSLSVNPRDPGNIYASACSGVYRSTDGALSWTRLKILRNRFTVRAYVVLIDPVDDRRVYAGTTEGLFVSDNGGQRWRLLTPDNVVVNAVQVDPENNRRILIGTEYQGILLTEDGGQTWRESNAGFACHQISWIVPDPRGKGRLIAGVVSGAGGMYSYDGRIREWKAFQVEPGMRVLSFLVLPGGRGRLAGTARGVYWQAYGSHSWQKLGGAISRRTVYCLELDSTAPLIYAGTDYGVYRSALSSLDFRLPSESRLSPKVWHIVSPRTIPGVVYAGTSLGVLCSVDAGTTWNVISSFGLPERAAINTLVMSPSGKERMFAGTSVGLFESANGGIYWKRTAADKVNADISSMIFLDENGNSILIADRTWGRLFYSRDSGKTWDELSTPGYELPVNCLLRDPEQSSIIYVGTQRDGIYRLILQGVNVEVEGR